MFAWLMRGMAARYDRALGDRKRDLLGSLQGTLLEIGPGTGSSLAYLPPELDWIGLEPNVAMHGPLLRTAQRLGRTVDLRRGFAHDTGLPDRSVDAVFSSLVLCSVRDLSQTLQELRRVLRPGGRLIVLEHVAAPGGTWLRRVQGWSRPAWRRLFDNCHPDRETGEAIAAAGFEEIAFETIAGPVPIPVIRPHLLGVARKPLDA
ncbi:MAG: class I SAM-dependent methyltransferase [Deltaproteobacteria bacterium]|nr:class I SAM-dependent methyltransferase [Deltaproteobacteria bacterium]